MKTFQLSKSSILSGIQCHKRLFLETHRPHLIDGELGDDFRMKVGQQVTEVARELVPRGRLISLSRGYDHALETTRNHLEESPSTPLFEASFEYEGTFIRSDLFSKLNDGYLLTEVKSATSVKDYYIRDSAIQAWVIEKNGYKLNKVEIAVINSKFVYPGNHDYNGLFSHNNVTNEVNDLKGETSDIISELRIMLNGKEPKIDPGSHCSKPFNCPFYENCVPAPKEYPVGILPNIRQVAGELIAEGIEDVRDIPDGRLSNPTQERVRRVTINGGAEIDPRYQSELNAIEYPRYYLDFETMQFAVPIWEGTRPYQQLPFQWSCHIETAPSVFDHEEFLDVSGDDPTRSFTESLIETLGSSGAILVYSSFEKTQLNNMAKFFPDLKPEIDLIIDRLVDLLPLTREYYYHPQMKGSWSIKAVLPTVAPDLDYSQLEEVKDGTGAQVAFLEAIQAGTTLDRKNEIESRLLEYCKLDTLAMVRVVQYFQ
jgi:hypothetical protein